MLPRKIMFWKPVGQRKRGRPRRSWRKGIDSQMTEKLINQVGLLFVCDSSPTSYIQNHESCKYYFVLMMPIEIDIPLVLK